MHNISTYETPYAHATVQRVFAPDVAARLAEWIADPRTWRACDLADPPLRSFYWPSEDPPAAVAALLTEELMTSLREQAQEAFGTRFTERFAVSANRYTAGQGIKIHNDFFPDPAAHRHFFTHRLIAYLSPGADPAGGGLLGIFERDDPASRQRTIVPEFNSGVLMAMGPHSYHAVSIVKRDTRYSLGFSYVNAHGGY